MYLYTLLLPVLRMPDCATQITTMNHEHFTRGSFGNHPYETPYTTRLMLTIHGQSY